MTLPQTAQPPHARSLPPARFLPNGVDALAGGKSRVCRDACALEPIRDVPHVRRQPDHARGAELAVGVARPGWGLSSPTAALFVTTGRGTLLGAVGRPYYHPMLDDRARARAAVFASWCGAAWWWSRVSSEDNCSHNRGSVRGRSPPSLCSWYHCILHTRNFDHAAQIFRLLLKISVVNVHQRDSRIFEAARPGSGSWCRVGGSIPRGLYTHQSLTLVLCVAVGHERIGSAVSR